MKFSGKVGNVPMNKWLNFRYDPDHNLDTRIVFRIRHYWEIRKVVSADCAARRCSTGHALADTAIATMTSLCDRPTTDSHDRHALAYPPLPFPSNRHHRSNGDCLEGKRENYQVCSVQYCVQQLYTVNCTHMKRLTVLWIGFCLTGPISLCLDSFLYVLCVLLYTVCMCRFVARWGGHGGIEAYP